MTPAAAVRACLSNYATFSGRARRSEYWWFFAFVLLGTFVLSFVDAALFGGGTAEVDASPRQPLTGLFQLAMLIPMLAAGWRRMHDSNRPGIYILLPILFSFAFVFFALIGMTGIAAMGGGEGLFRMLGGGFLFAAVASQIVLTVLMVFWLTRPSDPGPNDYGPPPPPTAAA